MTTATSEPELTLQQPTASQLDGMTDLEKKMVGEIDGELAKLYKRFAAPKADFDRLMITRTNVLAGSNGAGAAGSRPATRSTSTRGPRAGVNREEEFLALVRDRPGITATEAAEAMGIENNYIYRLRKKAEDKGLVRHDGSNHFIVEPAPVA